MKNWIEVLGCLALLAAPSAGATPLKFASLPDGDIAPFRVKDGPLGDFVRAYSEITGVPIRMGSDPLSAGKVTLTLRHPVTRASFDEILFQVLGEQGLAVVDLPRKSGWLIKRERDARDDVLPLYEGSNFPDTYRMITVVFHTQYAPPEEMARAMRSFMPANSRIIPNGAHDLLITAIGRDAKKVVQLMSLMDTSESAHAVFLPAAAERGCPAREMKIDHVTVENMQVAGGVASAPSPAPSPSPMTKGARR